MSGLGANDAKRKADEALKHIGTNALPYLLAWLRTEDPPWTNKPYQLAEYLPEIIRPRRGILLRYGVPEAFAPLGTDARRAVPELTKLAHDTNQLLNPAYRVRAGAAAALAAYGSQATSAAPAVITLLSDTNREVRRAATNALRKIAPEALTNTPPK